MKPISSLSLSLTNNKVDAANSNFQDQQQRALLNYISSASSSRQSSGSPPFLPAFVAHQAQPSSLPIPTNGRKVRDSGSLLFMLAFLGFLAYIIWDGMLVKESDVNLIVHGHDSYGNICGRNNKPIAMIEKSGKNFTDKPYTKYTLINAQFERYTLDTERSKKFGELYYIKQQQQGYGNEDFITLIDSADPLAIEEMRNSNSSARVPRLTLTGNEDKQSGAKLESVYVELLKRNQTLLNSLKSRQMYQYPPMYNHKPFEGKQNHSKRNESTCASSSGRDSNSNLRERNNAAFELQSAPMSQPQDPTTSAQTIFNDSQLIARHLKLQKQPNPAAQFNEPIENFTNQFEHVLIQPKSTSNIPAMFNDDSGANYPRRLKPTPEILNQYEVSNQLLYLTECVDACPLADHVELIFYRCMPKNWRFSIFPNAINVTRTFIDDILTDVSHCYRELIYIFSFALIISLALLILLRYLASFIIWSCLTMLMSLIISMTIYSWTNYYYQILDLNNLMPNDSQYSDKLASTDKWLIGAIFLTFLAFGTMAIIIFMRKRILLVTMLFKESGKAISDMPLLLLQPVLTFAALILITSLWIVGLICLQSIKIPIVDRQTGFVVYKAETLYKIMKWYHIFAFLWISHFAIACQHYVIGAAVSKWYFSTDRYNLHSPIGSSVSELFLYYFGSVALGSFLVAIFKVIRIVTRQIQYLIQRNCMSTSGAGGEQVANLNSNYNSTTSTCASFTYVWRIFIWFFDNIVMIINRDAYVEIAIHGHSFLTGAKRAFTILARNPLNLLAIKSVSNVLLIVAKVCVVFGTISMAMLLLEEKTNQLNYSWSPIVISALYAYIVAHWFLSVYEMVIDALFICYCEDYDLAKTREIQNQIIGSNFMSRIINESNMNLNNNNNDRQNSIS